MKRISSILFVVIFCCNHLLAKESFQFESFVRGDYDLPAAVEMKPMRDPRFYLSMVENGSKIAIYAYKTGKQTDVFLDLTSVKGTAPERMVGFILNEQENKALIWYLEAPIYRRSFMTEYYLYDKRRNTIEPLSQAGAQRDAKFSPDGRSVAFARDQNLFIRRLDFGTEIQVTTDGKHNAIINGTSDWVYEEEFATTSAFEWSPDSKYLCYVKFDEQEVMDFQVPLYGAFTHPLKTSKYHASSYRFKYPSAGEPNSKVTVYAYQLQTRSSKKMNVPMAEDDYIPRIRFTRNSNQLAVMTLNRAQNQFKMYYVNPKSAQSTLILSDRSETYLEPKYDDICFLPNGFTYLSEKDGYQHLDFYGQTGGQKKTLTKGNWNVLSVIGCDTLQNKFYFISNEKGTLDQGVMSVDLKGKMLPIAAETGYNVGSFNSDYSLFVHQWSNINTPSMSKLIEVKTGKMLRVLDDGTAYQKRIEELEFGKKQLVSIPVSGGISLNAWVLMPKGFRADVKYPVVLIQYNGPASQMVKNVFDPGWEYLLAQEGFVVVCADARGTGGRNRSFTNTSYMNLGQVESEDMIAVAGWLKNQSYADASRVGIWGWSYGGTTTLMCLSNGKNPFKAGIAVAPVVDWRYYNTIYTERYMKTPNENMDGYDQTSMMKRAGQINGKLLMIFGMADDNVRSNQYMDFNEALIEAGIQYETQLYPVSNHSIPGLKHQLHLYRRMLNFFKAEL